MKENAFRSKQWLKTAKNIACNIRHNCIDIEISWVSLYLLFIHFKLNILLSLRDMKKKFQQKWRKKYSFFLDLVQGAVLRAFEIGDPQIERSQDCAECFEVWTWTMHYHIYIGGPKIVQSEYHRSRKLLKLWPWMHW